MPLPLDGTAWPPLEWSLAFDQFALNDAWFTGIESELRSIYGAAGDGSASRGDDPASHYNNGTPSNAFQRLRRWVSRQFWQNNPNADSTSGHSRSVLHSPLAGNLATLSSDLLFAEPPTFRWIKDGDPVNGPAQDRLKEIAEDDHTHLAMIQGGEWAAGIGGTVLTAHWGSDLNDTAWIEATPCDAAVPEYEGSRTTAVTLWSTYPRVSPTGVVSAVFYHLERHEIGRIVHALYKGSQTTIGQAVPVDTIPETAHYAEIPGSLLEENAVVLPTGIDQLTAQVWRNLPTRLFRKHGLLHRIGRSDTEGVESILSEVDAVWSSWMRDIKIARARLIVPASFLENRGLGPQFDDDAEILTALDYADTKGGETIEAHQFEIRYLEHAETILALTKEVLNHAGYSPSSYGLEGGQSSKTATEVVDRTTQTERTRDKKILLFKQAALPLFEALIELDRLHHGGPGAPTDAKLEVKFAPVSQIDPQKEAAILSSLRTAMAASTKTLVEMLHPEWEQEQKDEEVDRILAENNLSDDAIDEEPDPSLLGRVDPLTGQPVPDPAPGDPVPAPGAPVPGPPAPPAPVPVPSK